MLKKLMLVVMTLVASVGVAEAKKKPKFVPVVGVSYVGVPVTAEDTWVIRLSTGGDVRIQLRPDLVPSHVARVKALSRAGFYDGLTFHRVIEGFMAQTGDPKGTGEGGSPLPDLKAEFNALPHLRGTVAMARAQSNDSANSQFYICFQPAMKLDNKYTVIGRVISGMQYVDAVAPGEPPAEPSKIVHAWIEADGPNAPRQPLPAVSAPTP